jgi:cathepsin L
MESFAAPRWRRLASAWSSDSREESGAVRVVLDICEVGCTHTCLQPIPCLSVPACAWVIDRAHAHCYFALGALSAETIESHWYLKTGELQELSEQFILDCTPNPHACGGTGGCSGGTAALAYARLKALGGIPSEWTYPYMSILGKNGTCHGLPLPAAIESPHSGKVGKAANVSGHVSLPTNSYDAMMDAISSKGPLAVSVDAGAWHDYEEGIFSGGNATNPTLDHLVQLVGYGETPQGQQYFLVRNSWTPLWGEAGYIRLHRSSTPTCGIDLNPGDGDGCKGGPPTVKVCGQSGILYDGVYPLV